jgi:hypothetical protein
MKKELGYILLIILVIFIAKKPLITRYMDRELAYRFVLCSAYNQCGMYNVYNMFGMYNK